MMDEPLRAPARSRLWPRWKLVAGIAAVAVAAPLIVSRIGSSKLDVAGRRAGRSARPRDVAARCSTSTASRRRSPCRCGCSRSSERVCSASRTSGWCAARFPTAATGSHASSGSSLVTWLVWWIASLRLLPFGRAAIWLAIGDHGRGRCCDLRLTARRDAGMGCGRTGGSCSPWRASSGRSSRSALFVRWSNPDLWHATRGGEKPMDFAYLNAVVEVDVVPAVRPVVRRRLHELLLLRLRSGGRPGEADGNPARGRVQPRDSDARRPARGGARSRRHSALHRTAGVGSRSGSLCWPRSSSPCSATSASSVCSGSWLHQEIPIEWWFWNPTRVIHPGEASRADHGDACVHVHLRRPARARDGAATRRARGRAHRGGGARRRPARLELAAARPARPRLGALWVTNTWDLPTYGFVAACGLALAAFAGGFTRRRLLLLAAAGATLLGVAYVSFLPFHLHYEAVFEGVQRWQGRRTRFVDYLVVNGFFLFVIVSGLLVQLAFARDLGGVARAYRLGLRNWRRLRRLRELHGALVRGTVRLQARAPGRRRRRCSRPLPRRTRTWPAALALAIATLAALAWPAGADGGSVAVRAIAAAPRDRLRRRSGSALTIAVEYYVAPRTRHRPHEHRLQALPAGLGARAIAAAVSVGMVYAQLPRVRAWVRERVAAGLRRCSSPPPRSIPILAARREDRRSLRHVGRTHARRNCVHANGEFHGQERAHRARLRPRGDPLGAGARRRLAGLRRGEHGADALRLAVPLCGATPGNPTIVGWDWHQRQQRPAQERAVRDRVAAVQRLYGTTDAEQAHRILRRYGAAYAVVGPLERRVLPEGHRQMGGGRGPLPGPRVREPGRADLPRLPSRRLKARAVRRPRGIRERQLPFDAGRS